jgi:dTDP-glucose pyrophosphorylase
MTDQATSNDAPIRDWHRALLPPDATVGQAIRSLDESAHQIVLVATVDRTLAGTLTDGDIRRGLLNGLTLDSPIETIFNRAPLVAPAELGREGVLHLMRVNRIHQLPVVDRDRRIVALHLLDDLVVPSLRANTMVIMVGGQGTRLRPHTTHCPKPMLPVGDKPMLEHIIERARAEGFHHFVLATHYLGHMVEEYFGDGGRWQVQIEYLREEMPLGTAGALGLLQNRPVAPFVVSNGDVLTDIRYGELLDFHCRYAAMATMAVRPHEWQHPFGVVRVKGVDIVGFEEKPISRTHVNAGIYVLSPKVLESLGHGAHCDMPTLFARLQVRGERTIVYPMHEPWLDIGRPEDYDSVRNGLAHTTEGPK